MINRNLIKIVFYTVGLIFTLYFTGCKGGGLNLFPVSQDMELGLQVNDQIKSDPGTYPVLPESGNEEIYKYIRNITNTLLNTGKVAHKDKFKWEVKIIDDDATLNAFCTPGGYIYVYTGLIKYLDSEDQLAGVMGHEIAHAALRHSTRQMTTSYGISTLTQVALGKASEGTLSEFAKGLVSLKFGRRHETESDEHSVIYLCATDYNAAGAAGFFEKIQQQGGSSQPEFLSTHPDPGNRIENIHKKAKELGCTNGKTYKERYTKMKALLR